MIVFPVGEAKKPERIILFLLNNDETLPLRF